MELALNVSHTGNRIRGFAFSIRGKILLLACGIAFFAAYIIGNVYGVRIAREMDYARLTNQTRLMVPQLQNTFNDMSYDVVSAARIPAVPGLYRAIENNGLDPLDRSTAAQWRARLNTIFTDTLKTRPYYLQMRFIGMDDHGRELARVNATPDGMIAVKPGDLQQKGDEPYFKNAARLPKDGLYYSDVTLNREHGVIQLPHMPVIRAIAPVFENDTMIGMVVINAKFEKMVRSALSSIVADEDIYVITSNGDYMMRGSTGHVSQFYYHEDETLAVPPVVEAAMTLNLPEHTFTVEDGDGKKIVHAIRVNIDKKSPDRYLYIAAAIPANQLFSASATAHRNSLILALALSAIACALALLVAHMFTKPLQQMNDEIRAYSAGGKRKLDLPTHLQDEIGAMAVSLAEMTGKLDKYYADLERSNKELDDFAYIASHDLKEPLRAISNHTNFLYEDHVAELDDDAKSRIDRIQKLCERAEKLVSELLFFARLGRTEMAMQNVDLNAVVAEVKSDLAAVLEEKSGEIIIPVLLPSAHCDRVRIQSVFHNLILNALKYNDSPEKKIEVGYLPRVKDGETWHMHVYYVRDNGIGIAPEFKDHVFRLFKRLNPSRQYGDGTGAGLTFIKKIIERHDGRIWLESSPGEGSTFYFTLPKGGSA